MSLRNGLRLAMILSMVGLPMLAMGCGGDSRRDVGAPGGSATAATERGGGETSASPGGPKVTPTEGTPPTSR